MEPLRIDHPVVQVALDFANTDDALRVAELAVKAGVDWLEAGTILINGSGAGAIGALSAAFPEYPLLADFKTMDAGGRNVELTKANGGTMLTVCANAADETVKAATRAAAEHEIRVVADTIGVKNLQERIQQCHAWGVDALYLHYGHDQHQNDPTQNGAQWIEPAKSVVDLPVGLGCFSVEEGVRAAKAGAEIIVIGHPLVSSSDPLEELRRFVGEVKEAV